jgi:transcriptional regulator with XRE-family HTH domain
MYRNEKIRGKQAELGLSNEELAAKAGVNVNTVSAIRLGKSVSITSLTAVVGALGLTMADVFEEKPSAEQPQAETVGA